MCLCWNDDGTICSTEELKQRIELHRQGLYKPELKKWREAADEERRQRQRKGMNESQYRQYLNDKYSDYPWHWHRKD